ncbi:MAG: carbon-nitrogen hydrolase family protein [Thermomicrobiales bacterium]|nr:carbon-nitrogen hydrolase family protein [Thermomicrobiales bacterium]
MAHAGQVTIALAQLNSVLGDSQANLDRSVEYIERAAAAGADLILFPELYLQGYRADDKFALTAEPIPGPATSFLIDQAKKHNLHIIMGMARLEEHFPFLVYNSLCFVGPDGLVGDGYYDKIHLGTFHPYIEGVYFAPGRATPIFHTPFGPVSVQICYDVWYPELTRTYALSGSLINLVISAGPSGFTEGWKTLLQARSKENLMPSVYCNVVGTQKDFSFFGGSKIVSAMGKVTTEANIDEEDFVVGTVDIEEALRLRRQWLLFRERRPDLYGALTANDVNETP